MWARCFRLLFLLAFPSVVCSQSNEQLVNDALKEVRSGKLDSAEVLLRSVLDSSAHPKADTRGAAFILHGLISFLRGNDSSAVAAFDHALEARVDWRVDWLAQVDSALWRMWRRERCHVIAGPSQQGGILVQDSTALTDKPGIISGPNPRYPEDLRRAHMQGRVRLVAVLDTAGRTEQGSIRILESPHPDFSNASRQYLERARFRPGRVGDRAVRVCIEVPIDFRLRE